MRIWDAATGKMLAVRAHAGEVLEVQWAKDSKRLLAPSDDGFVRIWDSHRDERSTEAVAQFLAQRVPWTLIDGRVAAVVDPQR